MNNKLAALQGIVESGDYRPTDQALRGVQGAVRHGSTSSWRGSTRSSRPTSRRSTSTLDGAGLDAGEGHDLTPPLATIAASSHGESRLRMLRIVRRGDRHDPRDLTVSFRFEGEFAPAFVEGQAEGLLPGETIKNLVHAAAREHGARRDRVAGAGARARRCSSGSRASPRRASRCRAAVAAARSRRQGAGQTFSPARREQRTASRHQQRHAGVGRRRHRGARRCMRSAGFAPPRPMPTRRWRRRTDCSALLVGDALGALDLHERRRHLRRLPPGRPQRDPRDVRLAREPVGAARALRDRRRRPLDATKRSPRSR